MWVCTEKGGLWAIDPEKEGFVKFSNKNGLPDNSITGIQQDNQGQYWISTLKGFAKLTYQTRIIRTYNISDGLPSLVFNPAACHKTQDGLLWWGNEKGLLFFNPEEIEEDEINTKVKFTRFYVNRQEILTGGKNTFLTASLNYLDQITLPNDANSIGFRFVALNFFFPSDNNYSCMLEGYDTTWINLGSQNNIFYDDLPSGEYTFMAKLSEDITNSRIASIKIRIKSSIWESKLFYLFIITLFLFITVLLRQFIIKHIKKLKEKWNESYSEGGKKNKYEHSKITDKRADEIVQELKVYIEKEKAFLENDFNLRALSSKTNISSHDISQALNQFLNQNFADFVNQYRVNYFIEIIRTEGYSKYTLTALSELCGFNSKSSFFRAFKKIKNTTPAEYIKSLESN
jgi:AraC-like DNA-binding protein